MVAGSWTELFGSIVTLLAFVLSVYIFRKDSQLSNLKSSKLEKELRLARIERKTNNKKKRLKEIRSCKQIISILEFKVYIVLPSKLKDIDSDKKIAGQIADVRLEIMNLGNDVSKELYYIFKYIKWYWTFFIETKWRGVYNGLRRI